MDQGDRQHRGTNWLLVGLVVVIAVAVFAAAGYVLGSKAMPGDRRYDGSLNVAVPGIEPDNSAIPAYAGPPVVDRPPPAAVTPDNAAQGAASPPANPMDASVAKDDGSLIDDNGEPVPAAASPPGSADRQGAAEIAEAIHRATLDALDKGGSVRWKKDGLSGYVIAGTAVATGQQTCREAYSTTLRDDGETRGPSARWCKTGDDGEWQQQ